MKYTRALFPVLMMCPLLALAAATCLTPDTLGDTTTEVPGSPCGTGCEPTLSQIFATAGYTLNVTGDQKQYQRWATESSHDVTLSSKMISHNSALDFVFGYYLNGDLSTFVPIFKTANISGYSSVPLVGSGAVSKMISMPVGTTLGFMIKDYWGSTGAYYGYDVSENAGQGHDQMLAYDQSTNTYVIAFEDVVGGTSDYDYNDLVIEVKTSCPPTCSISFGANPIAFGQSTTISWTSSYATSFVISTVGPVGANASSYTTIAPSQSTDYTGTATNSVGTAICKATNGSPQGTLNVVCTPSYSCADSTHIQYTDSSCTTVAYATCDTPGFCSAGSSSCLYPPPVFVANASNSTTGHLQATPRLIPKGERTTISWNVENVTNCSVQGGGDSWTGTSGSHISSSVGQQTAYTLHCDALDNVSIVQESITVNIVPTYKEQ